MSNEFTSLLTRVGIFAVLIAIFFWLYQDPQRDGRGDIVQAGNIDPLELFTGDCYKEEFKILEGDEYYEQYSVEALPCSGPHNNEIYATFASLTSIASDQDISSQMFEQCYGELGDYIRFSENIPDDDQMKFFADYATILLFNFDIDAENEGEPDPNKSFSCVMNSRENFTDFSVRGYFAL
jgi:hypothetical protein